MPRSPEHSPRPNNETREPLFPLGQVVGTVNAVKAMEDTGDIEIAAKLLRRHQSGDWGEMPPEDVRENELSVKQGYRLMSAYTLSTGVKLWLITEADRSVTTFLLPQDY